jgi:hypothetical protein
MGLLNFDYYTVGSIVAETGVVTSTTTLGRKVSPFIEVVGHAVYTFSFKYDTTKTANISGAWAWGVIYSYDDNLNPIRQEAFYNKAVSSTATVFNFTLPTNAKYIRLSASHIIQDAISIEMERIFNGRTVLKLYENGDLETIDMELITNSSTNGQSDGNNQRSNLFDYSKTVEGYLDINGKVVPTRTLEVNRVSDYIRVRTGENYTFNGNWDIDIAYIIYCQIALYDNNYNFISTHEIHYGGSDENNFTHDWICPSNVANIRLDALFFTGQNAFNIEIIGTDLSQQEGTSGSIPFSISVNTITVPTIIEYGKFAPLDLPSWVVDTKNPISFFPQGVVIKGNLIESNSVIFSDDFNRDNSNTLGTSWRVVNGSYAIVDNQAKATGGSGVNSVIYAVKPHDDYVSISADIKPIISESIVFRGIDFNNYFHAQFEGGILVLKLKVNAVTSVLRNVNYGAQNLYTYNVRVELRGPEIKVFVNNELEITHTSNVFLENRLCGIQSWSSNGIVGTFDNFEIKRIT